MPVESEGMFRPPLVRGAYAGPPTTGLAQIGLRHCRSVKTYTRKSSAVWPASVCVPAHVKAGISRCASDDAVPSPITSETVCSGVIAPPPSTGFEELYVGLHAP